MSEISEAIQEKCLAFADRVIKLNDYLLEQASLPKSEGGSQKADGKKTQPSAIKHHPSLVPVHLQSVAALANQLLRSGTSIGAKQLLEQRTPSCSHVWLSRDKSQRS